VDRYGDLPTPVDNLLAVARLRVKARDAGLSDVNVQGNFVRFAPLDPPDSVRVRLDRLYPKTIVKTALHSILVPRPTAGELKRLAASVDSGPPDADRAVLDWASRVIEDAVPAVRPQPEGAAQS
jgi:transcription-repair coupling factor (superfamily II helicase)